MRQVFKLSFIVALLTFSGCSWYDGWFDLFGDSYSGGGTSSFEKKYDYNEQARSYGADQW